jgi:hypothetical protein
MLVIVNGYQRDVEVFKEWRTGLWKCKVGKALVYWRIGKEKPYVKIPGKSFYAFKDSIPLIIEFLKEYKRMVTIHKETPVLSFEGETGESEYKEQHKENDPDYVSGVPLWLKEVKIWQTCSGKYRSYKRRVRVPLNYKSIAEHYLPYCCNCVHRVECANRCLTPELFSKDKLLEELK